MTGDYGLLAQLGTPLLLLDAALRVVFVNDEMATWLSVQRLVGAGLDRIPFVDPALLEDAHRACREQRAIVHRGLTLSGTHGHVGRRCDVLLTPLLAAGPGGDAAAPVLALEFHPLASDAPPAGELLQALAHELRNPLGGIRAAAQLLARGHRDAESQELCSILIEESDRLTRLAGRLLGSAPEMRPATTNVHRVLERVAALAEAEFPGLGIRRDYDPSLPELAADADGLVQALLNLVRNAAQVGARTVTLRTRAERHVLLGRETVRLALRIDVIDDGPGVPEAIRDRLFDPWVSARPGGTGLGLATALAQVRSHGGSLSCRSLAGDTRFVMLLPVRGGALAVAGGGS